MLRSAVRLAVRLRTCGGACTDATAGHPEAWDPLRRYLGRNAWLPETPGSCSRAFSGGVGSAPNAPERWLRSLLVGHYRCEHASQVAGNRVGRRHTAGRFGRQAM